MNFTNRTVLIMGANRGISRALADEALRRGVAKVYAGARNPSQLAGERITPLTLDVTKAEQIEQAVDQVERSISSSPTLVSPFTTTSAIPACSKSIWQSTCSVCLM